MKASDVHPGQHCFGLVIVMDRVPEWETSLSVLGTPLVLQYCL